MAGLKHDDPFYRPLAMRLAIVAVTALWTAFEIFGSRNGFWSTLSAGIFVYCLWTFLISWKDNTGPGKP
ncbi:MAG: DUF3329 domain-containing protein [Hyphomicrobiales bacterium]